jgi:hypothetical protein
LSLEDYEIRLSSEVLTQLVSIRLLRCDSRTDSIYYELSHDALIEPVLAMRQAQGLLFGWLGLVAGGISWLVTVTMGAVFIVSSLLAVNFAFLGYGSAPDRAQGPDGGLFLYFASWRRALRLQSQKRFFRVGCKQSAAMCGANEQNYASQI